VERDLNSYFFKQFPVPVVKSKNTLARILAIDYGKKRAGLAVSDPFGNFAISLAAVEVKEIWDFLESYLKKEMVEGFVVGYPKTMRNEGSESLNYINPFIKKLTAKYPEKYVELFDERFTSSMALQAMIDGGMPKMKRQEKSRVDPLSAVIILQGYLDLKNKGIKV
jgi:putative holliday junction resolvase